MKPRILGILLILPLILTSCFGAISFFRWDANCGEWLQNAANANTIEIAKNRLDKAIDYLESNKITSGSSNILWETPNTNIKIWYENLKATQKDLASAPANISKLEESNTLMKLRETLIDDSRVVVPENISLYPHQFLYVICSVVFGFLMFFGLILVTLKED